MDVTAHGYGRQTPLHGVGDARGSSRRDPVRMHGVAPDDDDDNDTDTDDMDDMDDDDDDVSYVDTTTNHQPQVLVLSDNSESESNSESNSNSDSDSGSSDADQTAELAADIALLRENVATQRAATGASASTQLATVASSAVTHSTSQPGPSSQHGGVGVAADGSSTLRYATHDNTNATPIHDNDDVASMLPWEQDVSPSLFNHNIAGPSSSQQGRPTTPGHGVATQIAREYGLHLHDGLRDHNRGGRHIIADDADGSHYGAGPSTSRGNNPARLVHNNVAGDGDDGGGDGRHDTVLGSRSSSANGDEDFQPTAAIAHRGTKRKMTDNDNDDGSCSAVDTTATHAHPPACTEDHATECPICMESCTNSGPHRIVTFKCGHLFGKSCILEWIQRGSGSRHSHNHRRGSNSMTRGCPSCKKPMSKRDMVPVFTRSVVAVDTLERDTALIEAKRLRQQLAAATKLNKELGHKMSQVMLMRDIYIREAADHGRVVGELRYEIGRLKALVEQGEMDRRMMIEQQQKQQQQHVDLAVSGGASSSSSDSAGLDIACARMSTVSDVSTTCVAPDTSIPATTTSETPTIHGSFRLDRIIDLPAVRDTARVLELSTDTHTLFVTMQHARQGNKRHGVLKINLRDTNMQSFIGMHDRTIRDCRYIPASTTTTTTRTGNDIDTGLLITTSLDKTLKLTTVSSGSTVRVFRLDSPGWSCCFDRCVLTSVYVGTAANEVLHFDTRPEFSNGGIGGGGSHAMLMSPGRGYGSAVRPLPPSSSPSQFPMSSSAAGFDGACSVPIHRLRLPPNNGKGIHSLQFCVLPIQRGSDGSSTGRRCALVGASMGNLFDISVTDHDGDIGDDTDTSYQRDIGGGDDDDVNRDNHAGPSSTPRARHPHVSVTTPGKAGRVPADAWPVLHEPTLHALSRPEPTMPTVSDTATAFTIDQVTGAWAVALRRPTSGMVYRCGRADPPVASTSTSIPNATDTRLVFTPPPSLSYIVARGPMQRTMPRIHLFTIPVSSRVTSSTIAQQLQQQGQRCVGTGQHFATILATTDDASATISLYDITSCVTPTSTPSSSTQQQHAPYLWKTLSTQSSTLTTPSTSPPSSIMDMRWIHTSPTSSSSTHSSLLIALTLDLKLLVWEFSVNA